LGAGQMNFSMWAADTAELCKSRGDRGMVAGGAGTGNGAHLYIVALARARFWKFVNDYRTQPPSPPGPPR